jgi:Rieske Fe-S protein
MEKPGPVVERRRFIDILLGSGLVAALASVIYPIIEFLIPPKVSEAQQNSVVAGNVGELKPNSAKIFKFGSAPGILVFTSNSEYRAFAATCTHLDCTVQYRTDSKQIWCACHNGQYDLTGRNVGGPPPRPLDAYKVNLRGDDIIVSKA